MRPGTGDRGQAIQVGAIVLFGFVVIAFAGYQAVSVPDQNQEVEFQHSMQVADQMQEFRADVIEAASTGATRSQAFKLGTEYPARVFAVNPPPASGRLSTTTFGGGEYVLDAPGASLEDICGLTGGTGNTVDSKALVYEPNYNVYTQAPDVVYENTVTYRQFPGEVRLDSGQNLVDGKTLTLTPLVGDVDEATSASRTVDLAPGKAGIGATNTVDGGTYTLTVPTALDAGTWEDLLESELDENGGQVESVDPAPGGGVEITLASGEYTLICPPVGLGSAPSNSPSDVLERTGDGGTSLNPSESGDVRLDGIAMGGGDSVDLTFENMGDEVNLSSIRYNFYSTGPGGSAPESFDLEDTSNNVLASNVQLRGPGVTPDDTVTFPADDSRVLSVDFDGGIQKQDYFVIEMRFSDGQESLYFVDVGDDTGGNSAPSASFTSSDGGSNTIDVDASGSTDPDGDTLTYDWDWTSDGTYEGSGETASHTYGSSGTYDVTLRVSDGNGGTDTVTQSVTVGSTGGSGSPPTVTINSVSYANNNNELTVEFTPDDPDADLDTATVVVENGNGESNTFSEDISNQEAQLVVENYTGVGDSNAKPFDVTVTVRDSAGNSDTDTGTTG